MAEGIIETLQYDVILNDKTFDEVAKRVESRAQSMNKTVSELLDMFNQLGSKPLVSTEGVSNAEKMAGFLKDIKAQVDGMPKDLKTISEETTKTTDKEKEHTNAVKETNSALTGTRDLMSTLSRLTGVTFGAAGIHRFVSSLVRVTGEFEVQKVALTSMLQDADKAEEIFTTLRKEALKSPYTFQDLSKYAKQLTAFNIDADKLVETERRLADVAAGLGVDMGRIILAYGQVKSAGVLKGTELRQFTEAGVPLLQSLADQIERTEGKTISLAQVFDRISKKQIPFEMVEQAFRDMTDVGGKFYNMQSVLVDTLQGKIGKLRDVWQQTLYDIGNSNSAALKGTVDFLTNIVANLTKITGLIAGIVDGVGAYGVVLAAAAVTQKAFLGASTLTGMSSMATFATKLGAAAPGVAAAVGLIVAAIMAIYNAYQKAHAAQIRFNDALIGFNDQAREEVGKLDELKGRLEAAEKGTEEYNKAKEEIVANYGKYYDGLDKEIDKVGSLATAYDALKLSVEESLRVRQYSDFEEAEKRVWDETRDAELENVKKKIYKDLKDDHAAAALLVSEIVSKTTRGEFDKPLSSTAGLSPEALRRIYNFNMNESERQKAYKNQTKAMRDALGLYFLDPDFIGPIPKISQPGSSASDIVAPTWVPTSPKAAQETKNAIRTTIDSIKELQRAYKDFKQMGLDDEDIKALFDEDSMFGHIDKSLRSRLDYWQMLLEQADRLEGLDPNEAQRVRSDVARGQADEALQEWKERQKLIKESRTELEKYEKAMDKWKAQDFGLTGNGVEFDVSKVLSAYQTKQNEAELEAAERRKELYASEAAVRAEYGEEYWELYRKTGESTIDALLGKQMEANRVATREALRDLSDKYVKEATKNMNLKDWGDKSTKQIRGLYDQLMNLSTGRIGISLPLLEELRSKGFDVIELNTLIKASFREMAENAKEELEKKTADSIKTVASAITDVVGQVAELGRVMGDSELASTADDLADMISTSVSVLEQVASGNIPGAIATAVGSAVKQIMDLVTAHAKLKQAIRETAEEARASRYESMLSAGVDTIFGSNAQRSISNAVNAMKELRNLTDMDRKRGTSGDAMQTTQGGSWWKYLLSFLAPVNLLKDLTKQSDSLAGMASKLGMDLYDEYGNLNADTLQAILDTYEDLKTADREWMEQAIHNSEAYAAAMKQLEDVVSSIFGDVASGASDAIVNSWIERGEAALDYADILDDVARKYAKMMIESTIYDQVLDKNEAKRIVNMVASGDQEGAMAAIAQDMNEIAAMEPVFAKILEIFDPYFKYEEEESTSTSKSSLKSGIQKQVEENSGLMASYLNAMRADLSVVRGLQQQGWLNVKSILETLQAQQSPNFNEYMAQIAGDTHDMRVNLQDLLSRFRSVITSSPSGGSAIRSAK